jgi:hypothetical protein
MLSGGCSVVARLLCASWFVETETREGGRWRLLDSKVAARGVLGGRLAQVTTVSVLLERKGPVFPEIMKG